MLYGKLFAGLIGLMVAGLPGLILGLAVGHAFDRGLAATLMAGSPQQMQKIREEFSECCFTLLGYVAKADGRVSEEEITLTEQIMQQMGVAGEHRGQAIRFFKSGTDENFEPEALIAHFIGESRGHRQVKQTLLVFLLSMAQADGLIDEAEEAALLTCAVGLGFSESIFQRTLDMARAQYRFHNQQGPASSAELLSDAYRALGVSEQCSDRELKKAYRKLMSENHPDKLIAQGVPEDMIRLATEKSQEIQAAYETVHKYRKAAN